MTKVLLTSISAALSCAALTSYSHAAAVASDNASATVYDDGWATGDNGGTGFGPWTLTGGPNAGFFIGNSSNNGGGGGNINVANEAWGEFANSGGTASAVRTFTAGGSNGLSVLGTGERFVLRMDNGNIDTGATVGFGLQDSTGTNRFEFFFTGGGTTYTVSGSTNQSTAHTFTNEGLTATFTLTGVNTYSFALAYNTGTPATETLTGTLKGTAGTGIDRVRMFNANAGNGSTNDAFFNSAQVIPEPSVGVLAVSGFGMLALFRRRRA